MKVIVKKRLNVMLMQQNTLHFDFDFCSATWSVQVHSAVVASWGQYHFSLSFMITYWSVVGSIEKVTPQSKINYLLFFVGDFWNKI